MTFAALSAACGGSDRVSFWKVAMNPSSSDASCSVYGGGTTSSTELLMTGSLELWKEDGEKAVLASSSYFQAGVPCTWHGSALSCAATTSSSTTVGPSTAPETYTNGTTISVEAKIDGDTMSGTWTSGSTSTCQGDCQNFTPSSCTTTATFTGFKEPVSLVHQI